MNTIRHFACVATAMALLASPALAAIDTSYFHNYLADDAGNTNTSWFDTGSADGGSNELNWSLSGATLQSAPGGFAFSKMYTFDGTGGGSTASFGSNGGAGNSTFEMWFRLADADKPADGESMVLFETGGGGAGFHMRLTGGPGGEVKLVAAANDTAPNEYTLQAGDFGQFLQVTYVNDEGNNDRTLFVNGGSNASTFSQVLLGDPSSWNAGGDGAGLGKENGSSDVPSPMSFKGDIAVFRHYNGALFDEEAVNANYQAVIPEPGTLALLGLGGAALAMRRRK